MVRSDRKLILTARLSLGLYIHVSPHIRQALVYDALTLAFENYLRS